jgi:hypothetical protein
MSVLFSNPGARARSAASHAHARVGELRVAVRRLTEHDLRESGDASTPRLRASTWARSSRCDLRMPQRQGTGLHERDGEGTRGIGLSTASDTILTRPTRRPPYLRCIPCRLVAVFDSRRLCHEDMSRAVLVLLL